LRDELILLLYLNTVASFYYITFLKFIY